LVYFRESILSEHRPHVKEKRPRPEFTTVGKGKKAIDGVLGARVELAGAAGARSG